MAEKGKAAGTSTGASWARRGIAALRRAFDVREGRASWPQIRKRFVGGSKLDGTHMCILIVAMLIAYQVMRSNWLPFYRPYSFASQPFDCFAEDIQFCVPFFFWEEI